ncbi:MAG: hypothetical protein QF830_13665, partial [Rhodospirillales bacterium]|nr:hypothetical protein [Rhodospirillales bacterium]
DAIFRALGVVYFHATLDGTHFNNSRRYPCGEDANFGGCHKRRDEAEHKDNDARGRNRQRQYVADWIAGH